MLKQNIKRHTKLIVGIIAVVLAAFIPMFFPSPFYLDLFIGLIINAVLAMAFIMMLRAGLMNLGIAAFWGIGAYVSAVLVMKLGLSFWLSLPLTALITGIIAIGIGFVTIGRGTGFVFVILSCVIGMLFSVVVGSIDAVGGYSGIANIPPPDSISIPFLPTIVFDSKVPFFYLALILLVIIILIAKAFYASWTGRAWNAIGLNPRLAKSIGVNVFSYKLLSFAVASAIIGLIGSFYAHYVSFICPTTFSMWENIYIQLYAILGGIGHAILGPLLGSTVMTFLPEWLRFANVVGPVITGAILVLLILFLPGGLLSLLQWRTVVIEKITKMGRKIGSSLLFRGKAGKV